MKKLQFFGLQGVLAIVQVLLYVGMFQGTAVALEDPDVRATAGLRARPTTPEEFCQQAIEAGVLDGCQKLDSNFLSLTKNRGAVVTYSNPATRGGKGFFSIFITAGTEPELNKEVVDEYLLLQETGKGSQVKWYRPRTRPLMLTVVNDPKDTAAQPTIDKLVAIMHPEY